MIGEIGHFALWLALAAAVAQAVLGLGGARRNDGPMMAAAARAALAQGLLVALSFGCLAASFVQNDFGLINVARNSNSQLPAAYRFAATWGSHEGSILLWSLMLAGWTAAVAAFGRALSNQVRSRVLGVLALIAIGFLGFTLLTSNPFDRTFPPPAEGSDLNPLLQDPGTGDPSADALHGLRRLLRVAFAFAIAALIGGRVDAAVDALGPTLDQRGLGRSSPSVSRSAAAGPTTSWAGVAGGSGIRSKMPPSCPGLPVPR